MTGQYGRRFYLQHFSGGVLGAAGVISTTALAAVEAPAGTVQYQWPVNNTFNFNFNPPLPLGQLNSGQGVVFRLSGVPATSNLAVNGAVRGKLGTTS